MTTGRLTTHVLDLYHGHPAKGMKIELWHKELDGKRQPIRRVQTNDDGRVDQPLLSGNEMKPGVYELIFDVADYFVGQKVDLPDPPFLDRVPIRFGIENSASHYHVPLLITPWGYNTYRGS
ncbi:hydroxyisourate hydrolase [Kroppenstedtia pulmonis]|uniref:5-hydroxyisourate hydrolase n=1 Tax=Kroppenstedtia pulmonis TaxID=1380685 RepID=A0A7D4CND3_9BACL|nr:hydroxyisourate hydrolase [Kroppenstedtia pulmonis]QKG84738.1 hydroxyisourate hydrolase [Kroppenstedtia pulmonis]